MIFKARLFANTKPSRAMFLGSALIMAIILSSALVSAIFATGQTFGQRCDRLVALHNSPQWQQCVSRLARGEYEMNGK